MSILKKPEDTNRDEKGKNIRRESKSDVNPVGNTNDNDNDDKKSNTAPGTDNTIEQNVEKFKQTFGNSTDLTFNYVKCGDKICCVNIYFLGLSDGNTINFLSAETGRLLSGLECPEFATLINHISCLRPTKMSIDFNTACQELLSGNTVFVTNDADKFYSTATNSNDSRSISEPTSQTNIKGPKDAFTENINKNVYLIRRRIRNTALRVEGLTIGTVTHTNVRLMYIDGLAKKEILEDIRSRLQKINIDCVLDSYYIEELIKTSEYSVFPTILNSEKPDSVSAALLEGRIAILIDGSPYVITVPALMLEFLQTSEDYYNHFISSSFTRLLRYISVFITLLVPALYITVTTFHQEIIPAPLLISIAAQREGVPFPAFFEVLLLELTFEILREAGIRMPRAVGSAISIVGALVLGQAAVEAGLISAAVVIVISITAIASFVITNYSMSNAIRLVRFAFTILAGTLGLYGVTMGLIILCLHLCSIKSATVPYLMPFSPVSRPGRKDGLLRFPLDTMGRRPEGISADASPRTDGHNTVDPNIKNKPEFQ